MNRPIAVLKFGGSVLTDEAACAVAVHEIYRYVRNGFSALAVCSAFKGETDELIRIANTQSEDPLPEAYSALLRTGELRAAACLALACDAAGLPVSILDADQISLRTEGPLLDAHPISVDRNAIRRALDQNVVAIVPGFCGRDSGGRASLLGRGGSDLTAIFLAAELDAERCRLVKDVRGWFATDAAGETLSPEARHPLYSTLSASEATRRRDRVVQSKAMDYAARSAVAFRIGRPGCDIETLVADDQPTKVRGSLPTRRIRVGILGVGTVGAGVWKRLAGCPECFEVVGGTVRDIGRERDAWIDPTRLEASAAGLPHCDVLVEALPDARIAYREVRDALARGTSVVTANKDLVARHGRELEEIAAVSGAFLRYSAAAGGACPILEHADRLSQTDRVVRVRAVLNATSNVVLDLVRGGLTLAGAIASAQDRGFAEADPSTDLSGRDAANKLVLLHHRLTGGWIATDDVSMQPVDASTASRATVRQVAELILSSDSSAAGVARVRVEEVSAEDPLSVVDGSWNAAVFETESGATSVVRGRGAGRWPTTEAIVADVFDIWRTTTLSHSLLEAS